MTPRRPWVALVLALVATAWVWSGAAHAAISFPVLTGRIVDQAAVLSPEVEANLDAKLAALEAANGRQLVIVTLASLQGNEIEDYGYQLGRAWGIGEKKENNGALFIIAPTERKVRIEVGYGLEPILTDAMSSLILQRQVLPQFKAGDMQAGIVAGAEALVEQLTLDEVTAEARAQRAASTSSGEGGDTSGALIFVVFILVVFAFMFLSTPRRHRGGFLSWLLLSLLSGGGGGRGGGGGGWSGGGGGGGGFSGGGGSFGGGGSSGSW